MKTEQMNKTIQEEIAEINNKLLELDEEKGKLIALQTGLENEKRNEESKATAERIRKARSQHTHKQTLGGLGAKFGMLNATKERRRQRSARLRDKDDSQDI